MLTIASQKYMKIRNWHKPSPGHWKQVIISDTLSSILFFNFCVVLHPLICRIFVYYTLSKSPGGHPILHQGLKLNSKISAWKYKKKLNSPGSVDFPSGSYAKIMIKKCRDFIKRVATLAEIQSAREAFHHQTLMDKCHWIFCSHVFVFE